MADIHHYFSFKGRATPRELRGYTAFTVTLSLFLRALQVWAPEEGLSPAGAAIFSLIALLALLANVAACVRRVHDLGRSGPWLLAMVLACGSVIFFAVRLPDEYDLLGRLIGVAAALFLLGLGVWLGFFRGTVGPNKFGPAPLSS